MFFICLLVFFFKLKHVRETKPFLRGSCPPPAAPGSLRCAAAGRRSGLPPAALQVPASGRGRGKPHLACGRETGWRLRGAAPCHPPMAPGSQRQLQGAPRGAQTGTWPQPRVQPHPGPITGLGWWGSPQPPCLGAHRAVCTWSCGVLVPAAPPRPRFPTSLARLCLSLTWPLVGGWQHWVQLLLSSEPRRAHP